MSSTTPSLTNSSPFVAHLPFLSTDRLSAKGIKGRGSHFNGRTLPLSHPRVPPLHSWGEALIACEWGSQRTAEITQKKATSFRKLVADGNEVDGALVRPLFFVVPDCRAEHTQMVRSIRSVGSAALNFAHVAMGSTDAYWSVGSFSLVCMPS